MTALEWGVNQSAVYPPGDEPFGASGCEMLRGLLERLTALGFTGTVRLDSHVGDFCYVAGADDTLVLAPDDLPADRCERIGLPADEARARVRGRIGALREFPGKPGGRYGRARSRWCLTATSRRRCRIRRIHRA